MLTPEVKGKILKTTGVVAIGVGTYLIILGNKYDPTDDSYFDTNRTSDTIIDAEFYIVED